MELNYSFLKDELALAEIRKHKWLESEKQNREVGFATAAMDWIQKYGLAWKEYRLKTLYADDIFSEKRRFRRFSVHLPIEITIGDTYISSYTNDFNLLGVSCTVPQPMHEDETAEVLLNIGKDRKSSRKSSIRFSSRIVRAKKLKRDQQDLFNVFLPFNESARNFVKAHLTC